MGSKFKTSNSTKVFSIGDNVLLGISKLLEIFENVNLSEFFEIIFKISITLFSWIM